MVQLTGAGVVAAAVLAATVGVVGCSGGSGTSASAPSAPPRPCATAVDDVVSATQGYIDGFNVDQKVSTQPPLRPSPTPTGLTSQQYSDALARARRLLSARHCDQAAFQEALAAGLPGVQTHGPIASAVLAQLSASLTGQLASQPVDRQVRPGEDLAAVLAQAPDGSTIHLGRGAFRLRQPLVLLRPVTLRGAGTGATVLTSTAADAAVLVMTDQAVTLDGLSVRHTGPRAGSVVVTGPTARLTLHDVTVSGARSDGHGRGGVGVLLTSGAASAPAAVTFRASGSVFADNAAAGVAVGGSHRTAIVSSRFDHNAQCGVCYLGSATGTVRQSTFTGNGVGVAVGSSSRPVVRDNRISGGDVGIQASASAAPTIRGNTLSGVARAAMVFVGSAAGTVDGNDCSGDRAGIAVARSAYPYVGHNTCRVTLGARRGR